MQLTFSCSVRTEQYLVFHSKIKKYEWHTQCKWLKRQRDIKIELLRKNILTLSFNTVRFRPKVTLKVLPCQRWSTGRCWIPGHRALYSSVDSPWVGSRLTVLQEAGPGWRWSLGVTGKGLCLSPALPFLLLPPHHEMSSLPPPGPSAYHLCLGTRKFRLHPLKGKQYLSSFKLWVSGIFSREKMTNINTYSNSYNLSQKLTVLILV